MIPRNSELKSLLFRLIKDGNKVSTAYAHNYIFEERVSIDRQKRYEESYNTVEPNIKGWKKKHRKYYMEKIKVQKNLIPETFSPLNEAAILTGLDENRYIARLERLKDILVKDSKHLMDLEKRWKTWKEITTDINDKKEKDETKKDAEEFLLKFCKTWNEHRDSRPSFTGFFDELEQDICSDDWPNLVRNRLGLGCGITSKEDKIPVALMCYPVSEVLSGLENKEKKYSFAVPTVLDGELSKFFFPSPSSAYYGSTLNLDLDVNCEKLTSEILHRSIDYKPEHFFKFGNITKPIPEHEGKALARLRNQHLVCLRKETGLDSFGDFIT